MGWSGNAVIGFKAAGDVYENSIFSGNDARLIACLNSNSNSSWSNVIYSLSKFIIVAQFSVALSHAATIVISLGPGHNYFLLQLGPKYLSFLNLGQTFGVQRVFFPIFIDALSEEIFVPEGFKFGHNHHTSVYVRKN